MRTHRGVYWLSRWTILGVIAVGERGPCLCGGCDGHMDGVDEACEHEASGARVRLVALSLVMKIGNGQGVH